MSEEKELSLEEQCRQLSAALEAADKANLLKGAALQVQNLMNSATLLTQSARFDLSRESKSTVKVVDYNKVYKAIYLCCQTLKDKRKDGVDAISKILNSLSEKGLIESCLAPISSLDLAMVSLHFPKSVVFCFVLVPAESEAHIKEIYGDIIVEEGGIGPDLHKDISYLESLRDGEFCAELHISHAIGLIFGNQNQPEEILKETVAQYLAILPKGTEVVSTERKAIMGLSVPYEIKFYNPLFKKVKRVNLLFSRAAEVVDNRLEQFNVFNGIEYFDVNNKELY